ncbi:MAG TPA: sigma-70 family RNA polymerase sigma factor [Terriglobales bacterium]|nr:sigma-70 family RNA polymerase sigma factor [Terriglobales bacterium]
MAGVAKIRGPLDSGVVLAFCGAPAESTVSLALDENTLARQAQQGDKTAFEELIRRYDQAVLRLATHLTGSLQDAQDIYQDAFLRAYRNLGTFRFDCSFYTWMYRIVTNLCLDHLRKNRFRMREVTTEVNGEAEERSVLDRIPDQRASGSPERAALSRELQLMINRALRKLSPKERMVFELKHYHGMRLQTVAAILHTTENTIKSTLFRATQKLRADLAPLR